MAYLISKAICSWNPSSCWQKIIIIIIKTNKTIRKDVTTKCTSMRSGVSFQEWWMKVCVVKTSFFFFFFLKNHPSRTSEIKDSSFWSIRNGTTLLTAVSFLKNAPIMHQSISTSNIKKENTANQRHPRTINWKSEDEIPRRHLTSWFIHATYSSLLQKPASTFSRGKKNKITETINCPSIHKHNHKPKSATHHDHGDDVMEKVWGKKEKKKERKNPTVHAVTEADIFSTTPS